MAALASAVGLVKTVYILHGWSYSTTKWRPLVERLEAAGIKPIMLAVPGLTARSDEVWDLDRYVAWLYESTKAAKAPFVLVGHSNGGRLSLGFALAHPERLSNLVLIDSAGIYHNELALRVKRAAFGTAARLGKRVTSSPRLRGLLYKAARSHDYEVATPAMRQTMINLVEADRTLELERVAVPTTLIWGSDDKLTPLGDGRTLAKRIKGAKLDVIAGARHAPFDSHPDETANLIRKALK